MMTKFILFSQQENEADLFKENINLIIQDIGKRSITLRQFAEGTQNQVESMLENSEIFVNERKEKKGSVFQRMVYSGTTSNRLLQFEQYFWVKKNLIYILTLTCDKDKFEAYQTIGEKILDSFEFTPIK